MKEGRKRTKPRNEGRREVKREANEGTKRWEENVQNKIN